MGLHKRQYLYLMYVWGHSYEFDNDNNWELMERFCAMAGGRGDIWYATNLEPGALHEGLPGAAVLGGKGLGL